VIGNFNDSISEDNFYVSISRFCFFSLMGHGVIIVRLAEIKSFGHCHRIISNAQFLIRLEHSWHIAARFARYSPDNRILHFSYQPFQHAPINIWQMLWRRIQITKRLLLYLLEPIFLSFAETHYRYVYDESGTLQTLNSTLIICRCLSNDVYF
jgi:hypothetical protein